MYNKQGDSVPNSLNFLGILKPVLIKVTGLRRGVVKKAVKLMKSTL